MHKFPVDFGFDYSIESVAKLLGQFCVRKVQMLLSVLEKVSRNS